MTPHTQFWIVTLLSTLITGPFLMLAWRRGMPTRKRMLGYYGVGYGLIVATLVIDSFINPPLILHGFFPGIGCGLILIAIGHFVVEALQVARSARAGIHDQ